MNNSSVNVPSEISREISFPVLLMMSMGATVGGGIFLAIYYSINAGYSPMVLLTSLSVCGLLAMCTAMSYAEINSALPGADGLHDFSKKLFGIRTCNIIAWCEWLLLCAVGAMNAGILGMVLGNFISMWFGVPLNSFYGIVGTRLITLVVIILITWVHYRGVSETGEFGFYLSVIQILFLFAFLVYAYFKISISDTIRFEFNLPVTFSAIICLSAFSYTAFSGFEVISKAGFETIKPRENIPKSIIYTVYFTIIVYLLMGMASPFFQPLKGLFASKAAGNDAILMSVLIIAVFSALYGSIYSAVRICFTLGKEGLLPHLFTNVSRKAKTPWVSLHYTALLMIVFSLIISPFRLMVMTSAIALMLAIVVNLSVVRLRRLMGDELVYGYLMPLFPFLPLITASIQLLLLISLFSVSYSPVIFSFLWLAAGIALAFRRLHTDRAETQMDMHVLETDSDEQNYGKGSIIAAVADEESALSLVRTVYALGVSDRRPVELLHFINVPDQLSMADGKKYIDTGKESINEMKLYFQSQVPVNFTIKYCRNIARGIITAAREREAEFIVLGWGGKSRNKAYKLGSVIDPVLECAPTNVLVVKQVSNTVPQRIFVPVAGGRNSTFAVEIAMRLIDPNKGMIIVLNVKTGNEPIVFDVANFIEEVTARTNFPRDKIHSKTIESKRVVETILEEIENPSNRCDMVVIGSSARSLWHPFMKDSVANKVAKRCTKSIIIAQKKTNLRSWLGCWL